MGNHLVEMVSQCFVKPKYDTQPSKQPYFLGPADVTFLPFHQIQKGLLFSTKPQNIQSRLLDTLKDALAIALVHFYPLAGRFSTQELPEENAQWVYLDCTKGPGARLIHASADETVSNILSSVDVHPIVRSFFELGEKSINYDGHTRPLLSVQVTELIDGVFIGFTMNHSLVDGNSQWHFINSLSEIFLHLNNTKTKENDATIPIPMISISQNPVYAQNPIIKLPITLKFNKPTPGYDDPVILRERIFHFSSESMRKLKAKANEECGVARNIINISSFQALSGLMWRSITRARNLGPDLETCCGLAMDARTRLRPILSNNYFGNLIARGQSICKVGELMDKDLGWAASLIHQAVIGVDDRMVREAYEGHVKFVREGFSGPLFYTPNLVMIGGSARFNMYEPDFGLGKAVAGLAGYCSKEDGKITVSPGREGGGSVDLEVCLKPKNMNALELDQEFMSFVTLG